MDLTNQSLDNVTKKYKKHQPVHWRTTTDHRFVRLLFVRSRFFRVKSLFFSYHTQVRYDHSSVYPLPFPLLSEFDQRNIDRN